MSAKRRVLVQEEEEGPSPRKTYVLHGQDAAMERAARAIRSGRPPGAWLIGGPPGIGKATLAFRMARYLLKYGATEEGPADLSVLENDIVSRQIAAGAHPGLVVLERAKDEKGKLKSILPVDEIRRLAGFFSLTAGNGWRIAIVDSADDLNDAGANALLKILEEPPAKSMLILIAHAPGRLLPTIRSRCRRLDLRPLNQTILTAALRERLPEVSMDDLAVMARLSEGSLGLALRLSDGDGVQLAQAATDMLERSGPIDAAAILAFADRVAKSSDGLEHFGAFLAQAISEKLRARALNGEGGLDRYVALWEQIRVSYSRAVGLHLDPRQTILASAAAASHLRGPRGRA